MICFDLLVAVSLLTAYGNIGRLAHIVATIEPTNKFTFFGNDKYSWRNAIDGHNVTLGGDGQSSNDVNITAKRNVQLNHDK